MPTVGELLRAGAERVARSGSDTPRLDVEVLLAHVLGTDRATLLTSPALQVGEGAHARFEELIERRITGEPVSYLRGLKEFYGLAFAVDRRALIPRPETETLVALALDRVARMLTAAPRPPGSRPLRVLDVGTGSGAIAIAVAVEARRRGYAGDISVLATDASRDALALAVENAVAHGVADRIEFAEADLTAGHAGVDLLLANLPYIPSDVVPTLPVAASFEPASALDGGPDGLALIGRLIEALPGAIAAGGIALLEMGAEQAEAIAHAVHATLGDAWQVTIHDDLAGRARVAEIGRQRA